MSGLPHAGPLEDHVAPASSAAAAAARQQLLNRGGRGTGLVGRGAHEGGEVEGGGSELSGVEA